MASEPTAVGPAREADRRDASERAGVELTREPAVATGGFGFGFGFF